MFLFLDSSSCEEEDAEEKEKSAQQSMTYKIVFFILLLILGAVATLVLVENSNISSSEVIVESESQKSQYQAPPGVPVDSDQFQESSYANNDNARDNQNQPNLNVQETDENPLVDDDSGLLDKVFGFFSELLEGLKLKLLIFI